MAIDWSIIGREHVIKACDLLLKGKERSPTKAKGLFVVIEGQQLPAKQVVRLAYCLASKLSVESAPKFSSGEGTVKLLQRLGFAVDRISPTKPPQPPSV